ncbi:ABC transporter permease [Sporosarcina trichiuri]|uniref:ABC transporter permease n=1 Tax=Sporosarcina trichiuri TaxID=3056445 RepID=UPI0025B2EBDA|nr:ABC transporter permease [Sporosarcina sp. 0.2-SM1T-5]WJY27700.1 ABC transporter permease [Sporosarcina sp. 0.2-SM1T-5]
MREFWIIFKQAFLTKARTKSFVITTVLVIAGIFLLSNLPRILDAIDGIGDGENETLEVYDASGQLFDPLAAVVKANDPDSYIELEKTDEQPKVLEEKVRSEDIDSFLTLDLDKTNTIHATYTTLSSIDTGLPDDVKNALQTVQAGVKADELSLSSEQVDSLFTQVNFETNNISATAKSEDELNQARILVYVLMFVIYFAVILYSGMIATEVATEKSSRVMEILISSVSPVKHMFAKVLGIGSLGIVQIVVYAIAGFIAFKTTASEATEGFASFFSLSDIDPMTLVYAVIFFLLGYFLYATLAALLGSLVSRTEDVQQMIMPMTLLIVAAFILAASGLGNPELGYLKYASFFPFFTPLVMFLRVGMLDLPVWEPLLGIAIMLVTIFVLGWFGARVYRGGVLMYGPSRSLKDIKKAIQLGKE